MTLVNCRHTTDELENFSELRNLFILIAAMSDTSKLEFRHANNLRKYCTQTFTIRLKYVKYLIGLSIENRIFRVRRATMREMLLTVFRFVHIMTDKG